jgi:hypothetical protein
VGARHARVWVCVCMCEDFSNFSDIVTEWQKSSTISTVSLSKTTVTNRDTKGKKLNVFNVTVVFIT